MTMRPSRPGATSGDGEEDDAGGEQPASAAIGWAAESGT